ncbi:lipopolysaccharide export system protein LptA [Halospina denitrificans]|uniref:Lipopolysaccharide export system protein LptA n=1 Tax=Halospina denitrificans TaxID=332522 RepID=A0A4R7JXP5_9GAMM|nr:lipopolysaccharide transport periplasmic protein LptA [Halospina denitrificans]TDT43242.1 lipopolysaccharide export system protein LptA [Halospina denitrificans]
MTIHNPAPPNITPWIRLTLCLLLAGVTVPVFAFDLDSDNPIRIESKSARLDDKAGTATYTGNVRVTQGEARLEAQRIVLTRKEGELDSLDATGEPATYEQPETPDAPALYAEGNRIHYAAGEGLIVFERNALIRQAGDRFRGNRISYDLEKRVVTATSADDDDEDRVEMTIQPGKNRDNN